MAKLYDVINQLQEIEERIDEFQREEDYEPPYGFNEEMDRLRGDKDFLFCEVIKWVKNLESEAKELKAEERRLKGNRIKFEARAKWAREWLKEKVGEGNEFAHGVHKVSWRTSTRCEIIDKNEVPSQYFTLEKKIHLNDIKDDLKTGAEYPFARLVKKKNIVLK